MHVPRNRIRVTDLAEGRGEDGAAISRSIGVEEKTVPDVGEDTFTLAYEAGKQAIETAGVKPSQVSAVFVGSESHPYAVKPTSSMVAAALEVDPFCHCADLEFACKAGTAGVQIVDAMVRCKQIRFGLAIGSDTAQSRPGDALEYTAAAGAAALLLGPEQTKNALCRIDQTISFTTDTPDFWRADGERYPSHGGRFTGEPGYFHHVRTTMQSVLETTKITPGELDHVVLHMPNGKFPSSIAKEFGLTKEQMELGFIVPHIGNTYSACSLLGLVHVLQNARKDERILLVSYGSGAGCDAFLCTMLSDGVPLPPDTRETVHLTYSQYQQRMEARAG